MIITAIKQISSDMLIVSLDGGEEIKASLGAVTEMRLYTGRELDEEQLSRLKYLSDRDRARAKGLELISRRMLSVKELEQKLVQKGISEEAAHDCALWLEENRFLDDEAYASALARHYSAKGYGAGRLRHELSRRGVERELWDDAVEHMPENTDRIDKFIAARLKDSSDREQINKVSAALFRRGFSWEEIRQALRRFDADAEEY